MVTKGYITGTTWSEYQHRITMVRTHWLYMGESPAPFKHMTIDGVLDGEVAEALFTADGPLTAYFYSGAGAVYLEGGRRLMSNAKETTR